jgi:hypothetical protein
MFGPSQEPHHKNGTLGLPHAYVKFQAWVWNTPSHIGANYHSSHS